MVWDGEEPADNPTRSLFVQSVIRSVPTGWDGLRMDDATQRLDLHRPCVCSLPRRYDDKRIQTPSYGSYSLWEGRHPEKQARDIIMNNVRDFEGHPGAYVGA